MTDQLPELTLTLDQEARAVALVGSVVTVPLEAARLIVHLQDRVNDLEAQQIIIEHERQWAQDRAMRASTPPAESHFGFVSALEVADGVFNQYRVDQNKWWKRMDGTPILNDIPVRMAQAFLEAIHGGPSTTEGAPK